MGLCGFAWQLSPRLCGHPCLDDSPGRLSWDKVGNYCVSFSLFSIRLALVLWNQLMGSAPKGTLFIKSWRCFLGQELRILAVNAQTQKKNWDNCAVSGFWGFLMPCAHVYLAQRWKGHFIHLIREKGSLNQIFKWIRMGENLFVGTYLHRPNHYSWGIRCEK